MNITIIQVYDVTTDEEYEIERFYASIQEEIVHTPRHNILLKS